MKSDRRSLFAQWFARLAVGLVFAVNMECALVFLFNPGGYAAGFELAGIPGEAAVQGFGLLFLMWNATYPLVLLRPAAQRSLFAVLLVQQAIGVAGETWLWLKLPAGHTALHETVQRFILFDGFGLVLMGSAFALLLAWGVPRPVAQETGNRVKD